MEVSVIMEKCDWSVWKIKLPFHYCILKIRTFQRLKYALFFWGIISLRAHYSFFLDINVLGSPSESWMKILQCKSKSI